jgi:hypothetical protein
MSYKSKEQFPLINNPKKKTYCHIDPRSGRVCSVHFHKNALKHAVPADPTWLQEEQWNNPWGENNDWSFEVAGYDMGTLNNEFGISFEEINKMQNYPPQRGVGPSTDAANELWLVYNDRSRREYMDKDLQVAIAVARVQAIEPEFRQVRDELHRERQNKDYPGNNKIGSDLPKSDLYYKLLSKEGQMFEERARIYQNAGYVLGLDKSSNEYIKRAMDVVPSACVTWQRGDDGVERTYWNQNFSQLMSVVDSYARNETVKAKYEKEKEGYRNLANIKNDNVKNHGTNDFANRIKPSPKLVEARVEAKIKETLFNRAQQAYDSSNIFTRRSRKKALDAARSAFSSASTTLRGRELE